MMFTQHEKDLALNCQDRVVRMDQNGHLVELRLAADCPARLDDVCQVERDRISFRHLLIVVGQSETGLNRLVRSRLDV